MTGRSLKIIILLASMAAFYCCADTFLVSETAPSTDASSTGGRRTAAQLRHEVIELMGLLIEAESSAIKTKAQLQERLCQHMRAYADRDKQSFLARASVPDLQKLAKSLRDKRVVQAKEQADDAAVLALIIGQREV